MKCATTLKLKVKTDVNFKKGEIIMETFDINGYYCLNCTYSDAHGRGCKINPMMPVMLAMMGFDRCPKQERKNEAQLREQLEIFEKEKGKKKSSANLIY